ncbi:MAG: HEPN domain-containing protein [Ghiorsea sp.]|nr:HEPN domain-containing protein [Ghiorsea sp.]
MLEDAQVADEVIGFHAQQAVEKCLKTVLVLHGVAFRKTHALDELLDLLKDEKLSVPENEEQLEYLTPYAVLWRYDFDSSESLARENTVDVVKQVYRWAENILI